MDTSKDANPSIESLDDIDISYVCIVFECIVFRDHLQDITMARWIGLYTGARLSRVLYYLVTDDLAQHTTISPPRVTWLSKC